MDNENHKWDRRFLKLAAEIGSWSKDPSLGVGAVIVDKFGHIVGTGYNGFPMGVRDQQERLDNRETKLKYTVHAELNAILVAGHRCLDSVIYSSFPTCSECAKSIIQSGIKEVITAFPTDQVRADMWKESIELSKSMYKEAGVEYEVVIT